MITQRQYKKLCQLCDQLLFNQSNTVLISYLHILRAHPIFDKKYQYLFSKSNLILTWLNLIKFSVFSLVRVIQGIFYTKSYLKSQSIKQTDVLFFSHLINQSHIGNDEDFYFGDLTEKLNQNNINCHMVMLNQCVFRDEKLLKKWQNSHTPRTILSENLSSVQEMKIWWHQFKLFLSIKPKNRIEREAKLQALSNATACNMRFSKQVSQLIRLIQPKYIITTYEGHAWEHLVYDRARSISVNIKCFAYQHVAIFEHQHALRRPLKNIYNPDVILTSGQISKDILGNSAIENHAQIICIGSPKYIKPTQITKQKNCCLVVPEGFLSECLLSFELSLNYAIQQPNQRFIWRLHPLISFEELAKKSKLFRKIPLNIVLSEQSLKKDIEQCDSVLYRGSTAVVSAINSGLKPIYYQQNQDELSIDPIYQQQQGKFVVRNQVELRAALNQNVDIKVKQKLQDFAQGFYTPLNINEIMRLL